jgi:hypothetical protein
MCAYIEDGHENLSSRNNAPADYMFSGCRFQNILAETVTIPDLLQVIGGLLIHQRRYVRDNQCTSRFGKLLTKCDTKLTEEQENPTASDTRAHDVHPFGQDAVFLPQSDLFNAEAVAHIADFYNLSGSAIEVPQHGIPHGFFSQPLPAFPPGFPVLFEVSFIAPSPLRKYCHVAQCALATASFICTKMCSLLYPLSTM